MTTSPQQIDAWLTELRAVFEPNAKRSPDTAAKQTALYAEALQDLAPCDLKAAVKRWLKEGERFPKPAELRKLANELAETAGTRAAIGPVAITPEIGPLIDEAWSLLPFEVREEAWAKAGPFGSVERRQVNVDFGRWWRELRPGRDEDRMGRNRLPFQGAAVAWIGDRLGGLESARRWLAARRDRAGRKATLCASPERGAA